MTPTDDDRAAALSILARQEAAWAAGDAAAFADLATADVSFTNIVGMFSVGREPFARQHAHIFATVYQGSRLQQQLVHLAKPTFDVLIVDALAAVTGIAQLPPGIQATDGALRTRLQLVLLRREGEWRVQSLHNVPINPVALAATSAPAARAA